MQHKKRQVFLRACDWDGRCFLSARALRANLVSQSLKQAACCKVPELPALSPGVQCFRLLQSLDNCTEDLTNICQYMINYTKQEWTFTVSSAAHRLDREPTATAAPESSTDTHLAGEILRFWAANVHTVQLGRHTHTAGLNTKTHTLLQQHHTQPQLLLQSRANAHAHTSPAVVSAAERRQAAGK